jgi:hypothetical protein
MRTLALALLLTIPAAAAQADPAQEARSATAACLSAIIDNAPVEDIDGDDVTIRRGKDPASCTVRVGAGEPVQIQDAVQAAIKRRAELFVPAKTRWEAGDWAFRETFCNIPGRRALAVFVSTNKPGYQPVLTATVFEVAKRDERCDRDLGVQKVAAAGPPPAATAAETAATTSKAAPVIELPAPAANKKKQSFLRRIPGLSRPE